MRLITFTVPAALLTGLFLTGLSATAQVGPSIVAADPLDPRAAAPAVTHRSAFADYKPQTEQAVGDWREANDTVGRVGGWRAYARESQGATPADAGSNAKPAGHQQHGGHR